MRSALVIAILAGLVLAGGADQAASLLGKGDAKRAAEAARKLVAKDPANVDAWVVLADALIALDDPAEAWTALESAIEKNPKQPRLNLKLGEVFIKMAELEQRTSNDGTTIQNYFLDAERMFDEALAMDGKLADAVYGKALVNFNLNRTEKAKKAIADCLDIKRDHAKCLALQATMFYNAKKYADAERLYEIALKLDDSNPQDMLRYGHSLYGQGKRDAAKAAYIAALKRHPDNYVPIVSGLYYLAGKDWSALAPLMREASEQAPNSPHVWYYLGYSEFVADNLDAAAEAFKQARKLNPKQAVYPFYLGYTAEKQGDAKKALGCYRDALKLDPEHQQAAERFEGIALASRNDIDATEKLYEELIKLAPKYGWGMNNYALILRNWAEQRGAARQANPPPAVRRRIKRSGEVYELAAAVLTKEAQVQSDCGLLFEFYPCNRDDEKAENYFSEALVLSEWTYRDAFSGIHRLCLRTKNWELLKDHAEGVIGALEGRGLNAVAPVGASAPKELKSETPRMLALAKSDLALAIKNLGGEKQDK